mmetsp:Transcript_2417/g.5440  ORF Transcript_2417/g.5440 Transcript_2417/m.5440 type:complete len:231 (+) Transcript_2417:42-734(+)
MERCNRAEGNACAHVRAQGLRPLTQQSAPRRLGPPPSGTGTLPPARSPRAGCTCAASSTNPRHRKACSRKRPRARWSRAAASTRKPPWSPSPCPQCTAATWTRSPGPRTSCSRKRRSNLAALALAPALVLAPACAPCTGIPPRPKSPRRCCTCPASRTNPPLRTACNRTHPQARLRWTRRAASTRKPRWRPSPCLRGTAAKKTRSPRPGTSCSHRRRPNRAARQAASETA